MKSTTARICLNAISFLFPPIGIVAYLVLAYRSIKIQGMVLSVVAGICLQIVIGLIIGYWYTNFMNSLFQMSSIK